APAGGGGARARGGGGGGGGRAAPPMSWGGLGGIVPPEDNTAQVEAVAVGELAEALEVELAEEGFLRVGQRGLAEVDHGRRRGLVVGDAGQQEHQPGGGLR